MLYFVGVLIDCELLDIYEVSSVNNIIQFSFSASSSTSVHEIHVIKLTEGAYSDNQGDLALTGYNLSTNAHMVTQDVTNNIPQSCRNPNHLNLLIIGDSITAAYGVDGESPCTYSASTQNFLHSYAFLTAQALGADLTTLAWSGKGVVRNYGDVNPTSVNPMPTYYNRTLAPLSAEQGGGGSNNYWDPRRYTPAVVLVMLGSNDYSTEPNPSDEDFTNGLVEFLSLIRSDYPSALIAAMCAPSNHGSQCANIEKAAAQTSSSFVAMDSSLYVSPDGCDGHPR
jgi:lysophospholipase L1-like esterase